MEKKDLKEIENNNLVEIVDKSGVEMAVGKLVEQNSSLLPATAMAERIKNSAGFYISNRKDLMELNKDAKLQMLYGVLKEAILGLEAGTDYDIIAYGGKPVMQRKDTGWYKIIDIIKPDEIVRINSNIIQKGDEYNFNPVTEELTHTIKGERTNKYDDIVGSYAYIEFKNGFKKTIFLSKSELDAIKNASPSSKSEFSPWQKFATKMVNTKTMKELAKRLFVIYGGKLTSSMINAVNSDEQVVDYVDKQGNLRNDDSIYEVNYEEKKTPKKVSLDDVE
jgi:phage RecT family recombinase